MNISQHEDLTRRVVLALVGDWRVAAIVAEWATVPDKLYDIRVGSYPAWLSRFPYFRRRTTPSIFGRNLASLTHFSGGYDWRRDPSVPKWDLPDRLLVCTPGVWGLRGYPPHPLKAALAGAGKIAADEWTYPSSPEMVGWISSHLAAKPGSIKRRARLLGAMVHFVEDACVWHHVIGNGRLLDGHVQYEGEWANWFQTTIADTVVSAEIAKVPRPTIIGPADHCARVAETTASMGRLPGWRALTAHATSAVVALVSWWMNNYWKDK